MNENKKTVIITSLITIIVLVLIIGISYAFFTPNITDDTGSEVVVEVATLRLVYSDTEKINLGKAVPGDSISKVLTVYNQGSKTVNYDLIWVELINTFKTKSDIVMSIGCVSDKDNCNSYIENQISDSGYNIPIMKNIAIEPQETHTYLVTISYLETNVNQDDNQGRTLYGKLGIREYDSYSTDILVYDAAMKIIEDNEGKVVIEGKKNPQTTTVATTDDGMYATIDQDGTTYYFRGAVKNNYLEFSGLTWRIVRINGDGSIRLVLDDMAKNSSGSIIYNGYNSHCAVTSVDSISKASECFKYGHGEYADYSIKTVVDNWYTSNITTDDLIYINQNTKYCNDYSYSTSNNMTSPYYRLYHEASLTCTTPSEYAGEAKTLTMPVGMLTTDEVAFAGGAISPNNTKYYLYKSRFYWFMSAGYYSNKTALVSVFGTHIIFANASNSYGIRPVISLKKEVILSGTGTIKDPYKVIGMNDNSVLSAQYLKINNLSKSNTYATSNTVNLYALANSATEMCFSNTSSNTGCTWVTYTPNAYSWNLTSGDGIKTVYAWFKDSLGNITEPISQSITVDTVVPVLSYFRINNSTTSQTITNSTTLTFYLSATDNPTQMCITTSSTNTNCVWKTYANSSLQTISTTNGTRIYYAWVKDIAGNISPVVSQSIIMDTVAPVISYLRVNNATTSATKVGSTSIYLYTSGTGTPTQMCFSNTSSYTDCTWKTYSTSAQAWNLTSGVGLKRIYVWYKDEAGNISNPIIATTELYDTMANYLLNNYTSLGLLSTSRIATGNQNYAVTELRYTGTSPNNYITFNDEVWRVVGVFTVDNGTGTTEYRVKIVRDEYINNKGDGYQYYLMYDKVNYSNNWPTAGLMTLLNSGFYYNRTSSTDGKACSHYYSNNSCDYTTTGLTTASKELIGNAVWYLGNITYNTTISSSMAYSTYTAERANKIYTENSATWTGQVGLLYPSDFAYSSSWLLSSNTTLTELTISPSTEDIFYSIAVSNSRIKSVQVEDSGGYVRPTVYLKTDVLKMSGTGTSSDPFIISL